MHFYTLLTALALVKSGIAGYAVEDSYSASEFFGMFDFFTASDPTHGFVQYVDQSTAESSNFINTTSDSVYIGVDSTNVAGSGGRQSVRITSNKAYSSGLVIIDLAHMPSSACGSWPAFWMFGPDWPNNGEIDIIEGVNSQQTNAMTLHTGPGCTINNSGFRGKLETSNCNVNAAGQAQNAGCSIDSTDDSSYGTGFNTAGGGVYATEIGSDAISIWFFSRSNIPSDISSGSPNPSGWGTPSAQFSGSCDISSAFQNLQIVFDVTFCGDWAGNVWSSDATCSPKASTCQDYVQNNPSAFQDSYWSINSLTTYQNGGSSSAEQSNTSPASSSAVPVPATTLQTSAVAASSTTSTPSSVPETSTPASSSSVAAASPSVAATSPSAAAASPAAPESSPAASPQPLMAGWFGQGSEGIPDQKRHRRHAASHFLSRHRRSAHGHGLLS